MDAPTVAVDLEKDIVEVAMANRGSRINERQRCGCDILDALAT